MCWFKKMVGWLVGCLILMLGGGVCAFCVSRPVKMVMSFGDGDYQDEIICTGTNGVRALWRIQFVWGIKEEKNFNLPFWGTAFEFFFLGSAMNANVICFILQKVCVKLNTKNYNIFHYGSAPSSRPVKNYHFYLKPYSQFACKTYDEPCRSV